MTTKFREESFLEVLSDCFMPTKLSESIDISIDPFTGRNPSYGFVNLEPSFVDVDISILKGKQIRGRPIKINLNTEKRVKTDGPSTETYHRGREAKEMPNSRIKCPTLCLQSLDFCQQT